MTDEERKEQIRLVEEEIAFLATELKWWPKYWAAHPESMRILAREQSALDELRRGLRPEAGAAER